MDQAQRDKIIEGHISAADHQLAEAQSVLAGAEGEEGDSISTEALSGYAERLSQASREADLALTTARQFERDNA